ncbi:AraC family transcriptional regulator [Nocardia abscessus]|uniref:AraC family transcriptional regulator n=1 Tax=Nocardia abscessus TaxID=120957 RepID=A0ABS0C863_9NOCA|nr:AraC family transcriptional regulator [Nocardia abscessus]
MPPSPDLAPYVEYFWTAEWRYETPYRQLIVPLPNVHLTFRDGGAILNGVRTHPHTKILDGTGQVTGVAFRHARFRPFLNAPVATITDRELDASRWLPTTLPATATIPAIEDYLRACLAVSSEPSREGAPIAEAAMAAITGDARVTTVGALADRFGTNVRTLQRAFAEHVGAPPKWVIRRYRLHEVTERLAQGQEPRWSALAFELGYADQAHLIRDFKSIFGEPPEYYRQRY